MANGKSAPPEAAEGERERRAWSRIAYAILIVLGLLVTGAVAFHALEKLSWLDSFYFATVTLMTIGYGDFVPTTDATKIFVIFYALIGVATVLFLLTNIARYYVEKRELDFEHRLQKFEEMRKVGVHKHLRIPPPPTVEASEFEAGKKVKFRARG